MSECVTWSECMPALPTRVLRGRIAASAPMPAASPSRGRRRRAATATVQTARGIVDEQDEDESDSEDALRTRDVIGVVQRTALEGDSRVRAMFCVEC